MLLEPRVQIRAWNQAVVRGEPVDDLVQRLDLLVLWSFACIRDPRHYWKPADRDHPVNDALQVLLIDGGGHRLPGIVGAIADCPQAVVGVVCQPAPDHPRTVGAVDAADAAVDHRREILRGGAMDERRE